MNQYKLNIRNKPLFLILCFISLNTFAALQRGVTIQIKDQQGQFVGMYENSYALVIGVSQYQYWSQLPGVKTDVQAIKKVLTKKGFLVETVLDPDSEQLTRKFTQFIQRYGHQKNARLLFYFAGHGHTLKLAYGDNMGYIVPIDAPSPTQNPQGFINKAMDMQLMEVYAKRIQAKHALFVFDSCFSGSIFALSRAAPAIINYKTINPVRQFITSGSANETVPDDSIFRKSFIAGLNGEADLDHDGYVSGSELGGFLQNKVINYSKNTQHPQYGKIRNPNLDKGDFVFLSNQRKTPALAQPSGNFKQPNQHQAAVEMWSLIKNTNNLSDIDDFMKAFPRSPYTPAAMLKRKQLLRRSQRHPSQPVILISVISNIGSSKIKIDQFEFKGGQFKKNVPPGQHRIEVTKPGFQPFLWQGHLNQDKTFNVFLKPGRQKPPKPASKPPREIKLTVFLDADESMISIDGATVEETLQYGEQVSAYLAPGIHRVLVQSPEKDDFKWEHYIDQDLDLYIAKIRQQKPTDSTIKKVKLNISVDQENSNITIDKTLYIARQMDLNIATGEHKIGIKKVGFHNFTWSGNISADKTLNIKLKPINPYPVYQPDMANIPAGCFDMGSKNSLFGFGNDKDQKKDEPEKHQCVDQFSMSRYEISKRDYLSYLRDTKADSTHIPESKTPITKISWTDAMNYALWLSAKTGRYYRLPTEVEWEYAARANTKNIRYWGNKIKKGFANCNGCNGKKQPRLIKSGHYSPNNWGLFDMLGNAAEWTCSNYQKNYQGQERICTNLKDTGNKVFRGGDYSDKPHKIRSANRENQAPEKTSAGIGFRLVSGSPLPGYDFVQVKGGCFKMKQPASKQSQRVCMDSFDIGKLEVAQGYWLHHHKTNPAHFAKQGNALYQYPVENISLQEIQHFIASINTGQSMKYRLPTEAEWEYAASGGGKKQTFSGGNDAYEYSWYQKNSQQHPHKMATKAPNTFGLYDMSGNIREWTCSIYHHQYQGQEKNCGKLSDQHDFAHRGGDWNSTTTDLAITNRKVNSIRYKNKTLGFRLIRVPK